MSGEEAVLLEQIRDHVAAIAEGHGALNSRMDVLTGEVRATNARLDVLTADVQAFRRNVNERFTGVETRLDRLETRVDGVETRLDGVETRLNGVETRLNGVETRLGGVEMHLKNGHPAPRRRSTRPKKK